MFKVSRGITWQAQCLMSLKHSVRSFMGCQMSFCRASNVLYERIWWSWQVRSNNVLCVLYSFMKVVVFKWETQTKLYNKHKSKGSLQMKKVNLWHACSILNVLFLAFFVYFQNWFNNHLVLIYSRNLFCNLKYHDWKFYENKIHFKVSG